MRYEIHDGRILTFSLETHVVDHCNLRCVHCCTGSPMLPAWYAEPEDVRRDLARAATALRPQVVKVTGGEPLLHPRLAEILDAVRDSGVADTVSLTTNGLLLGRVADDVLARLDRLTLSWYPSAPLPDAAMRAIEDRCRRLGLLLTVKRCHEFQRMDAAETHDAAGARRTFGACWLRTRCHMAYRGRFFTCTRPPHLADLGVPADASDGVGLHAPDLAAAVLAYLEREEPLAACASCLGGQGAWEAHLQASHATSDRSSTSREPSPGRPWPPQERPTSPSAPSRRP